jgi:hypothetical protein
MIKHEFLCSSANGKTVVFDPVHSHAATHFHDNPKLRRLAAEHISTLLLEDELTAMDTDMGRIIGDSDVVDTDNTDNICFAMRKNRRDQGYVPFTRSRPVQPSTMLSVYITHKDNDTYELVSTWIGSYKTPMFPQMNNATSESVEYWSSHAFVWGSQEIIDGTVLGDCPW